MRNITLHLGGADVDVQLDGDTDQVGTDVVVRGQALRVRYPGRPGYFYRHGWQSWSPTRWLHPDEPVWAVEASDLVPFDDDPAYAEAATHGGAAVGARAGDGAVLLIGALGLDGRVEMTDDGMVAQAETTREWFVAYGDEWEIFARYAEALGDRLGRRPVAGLHVWCSWYSYGPHITQRALYEVLADLAGLAFDTVQIDDGWQRSVGDWQPNTDFPSGMTDAADRIRRAGYRAGLWLAPFVASQDSDLVREHPEWVLRDDTGQPVPAGWNWGGHVHALDLSHPEALDHVVGLARTVVDWGFDYLKLDFLYAAALPGARHRPVERHLAYRQAVVAIRDAVGPDVLLLACGAPVLASMGVFDAIRIGPDVAPVWEDTAATRYLHQLSSPQSRWAVATSAHRLWLRPLIGLDPDVAYFRSSSCLLTSEQKELIIDLTRVCDFRATSDVPAILDGDERRALAAYLQEAPTVQHLGGFRWKVDGREVDFGPVATAPPDFRPLRG